MTPLARRLQTLVAVELSLVLCAVILAGTLLAFGAYVRAISNELNGTLQQLQLALAKSSLPNALAGGRFAASLLLQTGTEIVFLDATQRVAVYRMHRADPQPMIIVRSRADLSGDPHATGPLAHLILGLATAFGLQLLYAHVGNLYVVVKSNDATFVSTVQAFLPPLLGAFALAIISGILIARILTRQAFRPLDDVTAALGRFAAGDLRPRPIAASQGHELASLTSAYNGAIAQMQRAFATRDRANESMRQFIADAGHQLRTPLTVVQGFIAILRRGGFDSPTDRDRILDTMNDQSRIMASLIDRLILLDRWEEPHELAATEPIDVGRLVADLLAPIADANPERRFSISAEPAILASIDPTELGYIISNLADNALKYGQGCIDVRVHAKDGFAVLEVADQGPGIPSTDVSRVFDRFYRGVQRDVAGSGLGLAIVKRAVERARGTVELETSSKGSRFIIHLPRAYREIPAPAS